jgi:uncharacterized protein involved in exopolysaccharide biosynthesis
MRDPTSTQPNQTGLPWLAMVSIFMVVFLLTLTASIAYTDALPKSFVSTARIKLETAPGNLSQAGAEMISSGAVFTSVAGSLNLNKAWGHKYFNDETLLTSECVKILRQRLTLAPVAGSQLVAITCTSDDPREAAAIANAAAEACKNISPVSATIIDRAEPANIPVKPNRGLNILMGACLGVLLGVGMAMAMGHVLSLKPWIKRKTLVMEPC